MADSSNRPEPMTLIDMESVSTFRTNSTFKMKIKRIGFYGLLVMIPLLVTIIATVRTNKELKQMKIDFAAEMKITSTTFKDSFSNIKNTSTNLEDGYSSNLQQDLNQLQKDFNIAKNTSMNLQQDLNQLREDFNDMKQYVDQVKILNGSYEYLGYLDISGYTEDGRILKLQLDFLKGPVEKRAQ